MADGGFGGQGITAEPVAAIPDGLVAGSPAYRRVSAILFVAGLSTFASLYCVQPLMPDFTRVFGITPAESSLALSLSTGVLAVAMLVAGMISDRFGRKPIMAVSLLASGTLGILGALAPDWGWLLGLRALEGLALSGLPAVAMAYVSEEVEPRSAGLAMGLYIGGTAVGGMSGRAVTALVADLVNWRAALAVVGAIGILGAVAVWLWLPASKRFVRSSMSVRDMAAAWRRHLGDGGLRALFAMGFVAMGSFVTVFNYVGFRLVAPPFDLRPALVGAVFLVYLLGAVSSPVFGGLAGRLGHGKVLAAATALMAAGLALMSPDSLWAVTPGIALFTVAFFGMHSTTSAWIGQRATTNRGQASAIYLFCYYMGSTIAGTLGGVFWHGYGWPGVAGFVGVIVTAGLALSLALARRG
ncbi:MFS transporter [Azospirillum rugosum]|uniref:YNFM family putative membrane transporter n=1 Tax=Azospirillum rugosum TaxID=416170 RepID=A0ABS4SEH2_9PROT|nr:MFS transporter [Azospirillum rugosum]MBP2290970.1 YNFM family putative membrane transporter [Azospirillum rugosum]MDQ0524966.1 YNFM family putative membrane transporter [Azospirillum rugosum]